MRTAIGLTQRACGWRKSPANAVKAELPLLPWGKRRAAQTGRGVHTSRTDSSPHAHTTGKELGLRQTLQDQTHSHTNTTVSLYAPSTPGHVVRYAATSKCGAGWMKNSNLISQSNMKCPIENANKCCSVIEFFFMPNRSPSRRKSRSQWRQMDGIFFFQINKQRRVNPNSLDQQHSTATISKYKLQALFPKPPHNGCSNLPERG